MDAIVAAALNEISASGIHGIDLKNLWDRLRRTIHSSGLTETDQVKNLIWQSLLRVPGLGFSDKILSDGLGLCYKKVQEDGIRIIAPSDMRDSCVGIYDFKSLGLSCDQRRVLERLAKSKGGVLQNQLAKEFGIKSNNFFYTLRGLECKGLIVRQSTVVRNKDHNNGDVVISTNLVHLARHAKSLDSLQKFEITKESKFDNVEERVPRYGEGGEHAGLVILKDDLDQLKAVCDKLEEADEKVLIVSDLKVSLGYKLAKGHRAWRKISKKLVDAGVVQIFQGLIDNKVVPCIRLLKSYDARFFKPKCGSLVFDEMEFDDGSGVVKPGKISEQVVEAPIDVQIYDMIENAGSSGMTVKEVFTRLGLKNKKNYYRIGSMIPRFGLHLETEADKKTTGYRIWTPNNSKSANQSRGSGKQSNRLVKQSNISHVLEKQIVVHSGNDNNVKNVEALNCKNVSLKRKSPVESQKSSEIVIFENSEESKKRRSPIARKYASQMTNTLKAKRDERILERLEKEKFILNVELYRWLEEFEKDRTVPISRDALWNALLKLQEDRQCKMVVVAVPGVSNYAKKRTTDVVLHPTTELETEILEQIHRKFREFDARVRSATQGRKNLDLIPNLTGIKRGKNQTSNSSEFQMMNADSLRANGYIPSKMVRARMVHKFLWDYVSRLPEWNEESIMNNNRLIIFDLQEAVRTMSLELFLQTVGTAKEVKGLIERCKEGIHLNDLDDEEYRYLMDRLATGRLSGLIDVIRRLKLLKLVPLNDNFRKEAQAVMTYALELKTYLEEPASALPSIELNSLDFRPRNRHEFTFSNKEAVDDYWKKLEYYFCEAESTTGLRAFPGSSLPEILNNRSWSLVNAMSVEKRVELRKRLASHDLKKRLTPNECKKIAKDLNLPLDAVFIMSYEKNRKARFLGVEQEDEEDDLEEDKTKTKPLRRSKRKRSKSLEAKKEPADESETPLLLTNSCDGDKGEEHTERKKAKLQCKSSEIGKENDTEEDEDLGYNNALIQFKLHRKIPFVWTKDADRALMESYARQRAKKGPYFHRVDWKAMSDVPSSAVTCMRRFAKLKYVPGFKTAVTNLCEILYVRYLEHQQHAEEETNVVDLGKSRWDDFDDPQLASAMKTVLDTFRSVISVFKGPGCLSKKNAKNFSHNAETSGSAAVYKEKSKYQRIRVPKRVQRLLDDENFSPELIVQKSASAANAVELIKLVLLNYSENPELAGCLVNKLMNFSQTDVHAAFNFLRVHSLVVMSIAHGGSQPFILSTKFLEHASASPFELDTGERAKAFAEWLSNHDSEAEVGLEVPTDLHCGDLFHLFAVLSCRNFFMTPKLPSKGVGEPENKKSDAYNAGFEGELGRRERGFPGIKVLLQRSELAFHELYAKNMIGQQKDGDTDLTVSSNKNYIADYDSQESAIISRMDCDELERDSLSQVAEDYLYSKNCLSEKEEEENCFDASQFQTALDAIEKSGEEGLRLGQVAHAVGLDKEEEDHVKKTDAIVEALQTFNLVRKVDAFDHFRIISTSKSSKYFLSLPHSEGHSHLPSVMSESTLAVKGDCSHLSHSPAIAQDAPSAIEGSTSDLQDPTLTIQALDHQLPLHDTHTEDIRDEESSTPIYPWMDKSLFKSLSRRVFGIVMQSPGIMEDSLIQQLDVLNPQSARKLLELLRLDNHLSVRTMRQISSNLPSMLKGITGGDITKPKAVWVNHYYANPKSTYML